MQTTTKQQRHSCPMCNAELYKRHCKYVCPNHGHVIDCEDPFK